MRSIPKLPTSPGCYLFKDASGTIIYIGKAGNLRKRVASYFQKTIHDPKTIQLIERIEDIDYILTDTEVEAFILENTLIKKHQPKYNINLRDAKTYAYLRITDEEYPRVQIARQKDQKARYYGPFVSAAERDYILWFIKHAFPLRTCSKLPKKPCLRYHIKLCDAPCAGLVTREAYQQKIEKIALLLEGHVDELLKVLEQEMTTYSQTMQYEKALIVRKEREAIDHLRERQNMVRQRQFNEDILDYVIRDETVYLMLFNIYKGTLSNKNEFVFPVTPEFLDEFLVQYYSENPVPRELIMREKPTDSLVTFLSGQRQSKVIVTIPQRGEKHQLLTLVQKNIELGFFGDMGKLQEVKKRLQLHEVPVVMECIDISHISGSAMVGSLIQFRNGRPDKSNYRRFRIRTVEKVDDTAAIAEVVRRRYSRLKREDAEFPQLLVIDGGRGQLNAALGELRKIDVHLPVVSLAKRDEEIYLPGMGPPLRLPRSDRALQALQGMRDEAHRFAIAYHHVVHRKEVLS
jgi:excinuclease ABC subunit C